MCNSCHPDPADIRRRELSRRSVIAGGLAASLLPFAASRAGAQDATANGEGIDDLGDQPTTSDYGFLPPRPKTEKHVRPIMFPVLPDATLGKASWSDTYLAPRSGGRLHEGQDLMGNKMLKLLAVTNGTIVELRHQSSGNSLYLKGDDGWYYCYLHINNDDPGTDNGANRFQFAYAPGMAIGKRVLKGEHIAYLGDSGNAEATGAHLHFEIRMPNAKWYNAAAVNAAYSLTAAEPAKLRAKVQASAFKPLSGVGAFVLTQSADFLGGKTDKTWSDRAIEDLEGGVVSLDAFIEGLLDHPASAGVTAPTIRLYLGYFLRMPDYGGLDYWFRQVWAGRSLDLAASQFAASSEFIRRYGELDNSEYLDLIYRNLFDRDPDPSGKDYWLRRLDAGMKRGALMRQFCESSEYRRDTASKVRVLQVHAAMLKRMPTAAEWTRWSDWDAALPDKGLQDLVQTLRTSEEYAARFA
jgi:murein DD-endopeptidase MepM/ murein hydrolase activator NlpD